MLKDRLRTADYIQWYGNIQNSNPENLEAAVSKVS